jgi:hypothetical protein
MWTCPNPAHCCGISALNLSARIHRCVRTSGHSTRACKKLRRTGTLQIYAEAGENVDRRTDAGDGRTDKGARTDARTKAAPRTGASAARDPRAGPWARAAGALATMLPARSRAGCCRRGVTPTRVEPASAVSASAMVAGLPCHRSTARQRSGCGWACRRLGMSTVGHAMASI